MGWMRGHRAHRTEDAKYGDEAIRKISYFNSLPPPYFFSAVRSFGEYGAERDEIRPSCRFRSQELRGNNPANTRDFRRSDFGERDLPKG
jgi:hypothetical protein